MKGRESLWWKRSLNLGTMFLMVSMVISSQSQVSAEVMVGVEGLACRDVVLLENPGKWRQIKCPFIYLAFHAKRLVSSSVTTIAMNAFRFSEAIPPGRIWLRVWLLKIQSTSYLIFWAHLN